MDSAENLIAALSFRRPARIPMIDMGYWSETLERWRAEGLPAAVLEVPDQSPSGADIRTFWGADYVERSRMLRVADHFGLEYWPGHSRLPISESLYPSFRAEVLEDLGDTVIYRDGQGIVVKKPKTATAFPAFLDFPVKTLADYEALLPRMQPDDPGRYAPGWELWAAHLRSQGRPVCIFVRGFFGFPRNLMGFERLCTAYYDEPKLIERIVQDRCEFIKRLFSPVLERIHIHCALIWEDMAYNHGSMISPRTFRRFMLPYYQEINDFFHSKGVDRTLVDSDGNIVELCALFAEGRVDGVYPLEIAAGSDPLVLRERYPDLALIGGVDKRALAQGPDAIDRELERLAPLVESGGFVPMVDHYLPPDISFADYLHYRRRMAELCNFER